MRAREQRRRGYSRGSERDTRREGAMGVTPILFRQKRGLWRGRQRQPSLLLAGTMWSTPLPLFSFRGALFHMQTVAVAPTCLAKRCIQTGRAEKRKRRGVRMGWGRRVGLRGEWVRSRMPVLSGHWCHACAHRGRAAEGLRHPFFSFPLHSLFFQDEWIFQKLWPIVSHNRLRLSQFYAAFPVRGGSLSVGIEDQCEAVKTTRGCRSNTLWPWKKQGEERRGSSNTLAAYKHINPHSQETSWGALWKISKGRDAVNSTNTAHFIGDLLIKHSECHKKETSWTHYIKL